MKMKVTQLISTLPLMGASLWGTLVHAEVAITKTYQPPAAASATVASSPSASPNPQWSNLLGNSLYYYDIQRSGILPNNFRVSWRNNSVLDDGKDAGYNLSGGFFDAGNYIKATLPLCWVVTQMAWSALTFGDGYDAANQTPYLDRTLRVGLDWLLEASSKPDSMVVIIGSENDDNVYWGGDSGIPSNDRPTYMVTKEKPGTDVFGSCASAFAASSMLYSGVGLPISPTANGSAASLQDSDYAAKLLSRAQSLFNLADKATPRQQYQKAVPQVAWAYPSTDYVDELILSSTLLAMATGQKNYSQFAESTYSDNGYPQNSGALNWDGHGPAAPVLLAQAAVLQPSLGLKLSKYQTDSELWLDNLVNGKMDSTFKTKGGLTWWKGDSDSASLNPAMNAAGLATIYSGLASSPKKTTTYLDWAQTQLDYVLGKNPANVVYSVGMHPNSPTNPHSALTAGDGNVNDIDKPGPELHTLYGGVVGGPNQNDGFADKRSDWMQSEVALDSVSPILALVAHKISNGDPDPYFVTLTASKITTGGDDSEDEGLSTAAKVGIAIGVIILVLLILAALAYWKRERIAAWRRRRTGRPQSGMEGYSEMDTRHA